MRTTKVTSSFLALVLSLAGGQLLVACGDDSQRSLDDRPLAERLGGGLDAPVSTTAPWWRSAVEASPSTRWTVDGVVNAGADLFVVGQVTAVDGLVGIAESGSTPNDGAPPTFVEFNGEKALTDVLAVDIKIDSGVAADGGSLPATVRIVLSVAAPTDLESARAELMSIGSVGAIIYRSPFATDENNVYEVLDSFFIGQADADTVRFGELTQGGEFFKPETVSISDIIAGAGQIDLITVKDLGLVRATEYQPTE